MNLVPCPLCREAVTESLWRDSRREYQQCPDCRLIFVPAKYHLSPAEEKAVYDHHENSPDDSRYRNFLKRILDPVAQRITPNSRGLDFGSGPGPTLSVMFTEAGHVMEIYDPYYSADASPLNQDYDFVTASEVVEHFCDPQTDLNRMWDCVCPGGVLGIMTKMARDLAAFRNWHYKNDPTHVSFFLRETFAWLAGHWGAELIIAGEDVVLFTKARQAVPNLPR